MDLELEPYDYESECLKKGNSFMNNSVRYMMKFMFKVMAHGANTRLE